MGNSQSLFKKRKKKNIKELTLVDSKHQDKSIKSYSLRSPSQATTHHTDNTQRTSFSTNTTLTESNKMIKLLDSNITTDKDIIDVVIHNVNNNNNSNSNNIENNNNNNNINNNNNNNNNNSNNKNDINSNNNNNNSNNSNNNNSNSSNIDNNNNNIINNNNDIENNEVSVNNLRFNKELSERDIIYAKHAAAAAIGFDPLDYENSPWYSNENSDDHLTMVKNDSLDRQLYRDIFTFYDNRSKENDRQQRQHYLLKKLLGGNYKIPLPSSPNLIINWNCGTANWVMELSQELNCKIVGIDEEDAMLPSLIHSSGKFEFINADLYSGVTGLENYGDNQADYIMMRDVWLINQPIYRWLKLLKQVFRVLKPGGYIEIIERDQRVRSAGPELTTLINWTKNLYKSITDGVDINSVLTDYLKQVGYNNITEACYRVPIGEWSEYSHECEMGYLNQDMLDRHYHLLAYHIGQINNIREKDVLEKITDALNECEEYKSWVIWKYYSAQKPPIN